jgi:PAS domain S-box-containing protein
MAAGSYFDDGNINAKVAGVLTAIERSTAIIEFSMDGHVLRANDRFLAAMGYEENEILGIHHSLFVDPAYATSESYRAFWSRLRRGEYIADKFRRVGKGGREIWIQATYNPILGADGLPEKVVKCAADITAQEVFARDAQGQLQAISRSKAVAEFDVDGVILNANENFCRLVGYALSEIQGRRHQMFVDPELSESEEYTAFWMALRRGEFQASRFRRIGKGGREIWIEAAYNPIIEADGTVSKIVKFATDITAQELFARDARGQLQAISRAQAVIEFMVDGTILWANDNFCRLMGYRLEEIRAKHHQIFVDAEYASSAEYEDFWSLLSRGAYQAAKYRRFGKGGREVWIQASYNPIYDERGLLVKVVKYATDITDQVARDAEAGELRRLNAELQVAKKDAEEGMRVKSQFLATMSHEIRTPMNGILGMLEVVLRSEMSAAQRDQIVTARDSAASLLHILNDVLDFSKLESGRLELERVPYSLRLVVDEVSSMFEAQVRSKGLAMRVHVDPAVPDWVSGDPTRMRQVLTNLVSNAVKFTDGGAIEVLLQSIGTHDAERLRVEVRDTGVGIDSDVKARLFERFSQADASTTRRFGGTGLGLAICRELVESMEGRIGVESLAGRGSVFWFELPLTPTFEPTAAGGSAITDHLNKRPCDILIAEDNPVNRKVLALLLEPYPHRLTFVGNGVEALEAVKTRGYDLVFMDISMPAMSGPDATREIRKLGGAAATVPIIALTANAMAGDREAYLEAGMTDYVSKPIELDKVLEAIARNAPEGSGQELPWVAERGVAPAEGDDRAVIQDLDRLLAVVRGVHAA